MKRNNLTYLGLAALLFAAACKPNLNTAVPSKGNADFGKYIAVGNSLTSGFADGGLYLEGQKVAYPNLIADKMKEVGGGVFNTPFFSDAQANGSGYKTLKGFDASGSPILGDVTNNLAYTGQQRIIPPFPPVNLLTKYTGDINNLGVPGMRVDLATQASFGALNNYFDRLLPAGQEGGISYLQFIAGRNHTFFSLWLGNNDALGWATSGGAPTPGDPTGVLTDKATFAGAYSLAINALTSKGEKGILATIPDVTSIPFFNAVTPSALLAKAKAINPAAQAIFITSSDAGVRVATDEDLVVLTFLATGKFGVNGYGLSPLNPMESKYVLDKAEVAKVRDYITSYNNTIKSFAASKGLALVDTYTFLNNVKNATTVDGKKGINYDGVNVNADYIKGGAFSLDGIHLTPLGNAIIANEFIKAINAKYGSSLSTVNVSQYRGVKFP